MFNAVSYHYKMSLEEIGQLTVHQFNSKIEFLSRMFSDKKPEQNTSSSNYGILDQAYGVK